MKQFGILKKWDNFTMNWSYWNEYSVVLNYDESKIACKFEIGIVIFVFYI